MHACLSWWVVFSHNSAFKHLKTRHAARHTTGENTTTNTNTHAHRGDVYVNISNVTEDSSFLVHSFNT